MFIRRGFFKKGLTQKMSVEGFPQGIQGMNGALSIERDIRFRKILFGQREALTAMPAKGSYLGRPDQTKAMKKHSLEGFGKKLAFAITNALPLGF